MTNFKKDLLIGGTHDNKCSLGFLRNTSRVLTQLTCFSVDGLCFKLYSKLVIVATISLHMAPLKSSFTSSSAFETNVTTSGTLIGWP